MSYLISLLDKSPIPEGASAADALAHTVLQARRAEALGYHRFWVAEHHGTPGLAGSAPELLVAHILAKTSRIRVGSGGVMLQHYSPYKVAESFRLLAALAPGRVDLGVGKAPGGLPLSTRALQAWQDPARKPDFNAQLTQLDAYLSQTVAVDEALVAPVPPELPQRVLLGGSPGSARLAAGLGWDFCYAGHFNGDPANIEQSLAAYERVTGRVPSLALYAYAAPTAEEAAAQVGELRIHKVHLADGLSVNLPSLAAAAEYARQAGMANYRSEETRPHVLTGTADQVHEALDRLHRRYRIPEFVIDTPVIPFALRRQSIELLGEALSSVAA
ncbi:MAG: MsnO8 family LLM class oxidoreductase [Curvibacter sp.]|nr:MsnO8 family LLM class oxidoreductase [Curvibacter sp.]